MSTIKYEANFTSALAGILWQPEVKADDASSFTERVESLIARGQQAAAKRRYSEAIGVYKEAQSLIFRLLHPRHPIGRHILDDNFQLPVGAELETKIAEAGLKLAEATQPGANLPLPPVGVVGTSIPDAAMRFDAIGFTRNGVPQSVRDQSALGVSLLAQGLHDQAATVLQSALAALGQPGTVEASSLAASVALNLSSAHVLAGHPADAQSAASTAQTLFAGLKDRAGEAEALHNEAVALQRAGQADQAKAAFEKASELTKPLMAAARGSSVPLLERVLGPVTAHLRADAPAAGEPAASAALATSASPSAAIGVRPLTALGASAVVAPISPAPALGPISSPSDLSFITSRDADVLALRLPGLAVSGGSQGAAVSVPDSPAKTTWSWGVPVGDRIVELIWKDGVRPDTHALIDSLYLTRITARSVRELSLTLTGQGEANAYLAHIYSFVIPQALGDCYSQMGEYALAESYYLQAASYSYINVALEVPALWVRIAENALRWGDALYRDEQTDACKPIYAKLITKEGAAPTDSPLYTLAVFSGPAADARRLIASLANPGAAGVNPAISAPILTTWARWQYLLAGLDFFGTTFTPILTFEYLQQAAVTFAQQSVQAEREYIDFQSRSEAEAATRRELQGAAIMAGQAVSAQGELYQASQADTAAMDASVALAQLRTNQAVADKNAYAVDGYWQYVSASIAAAHGAHSDWYEDEIRQLATNMENGSWKGEYGKLAAAATLLGGQKSYEYQLQRLQDNIDDMNATIPIAQQQAQAAQHREEAARLQYESAQARAQLAQDALNAFDNAVFTVEVWARMAQVMRSLSQDYQDWAIRTARLMERAYNFENDENVKVIRSQYPGVAAADNLFGSDLLLRDIQSFTDRFIAHQRAKLSQLKDVISLANQYPFDFLRFQQTGQLRFETTLHDADMRHPGFHGQRIAGIELEVVGLLPPEGIHGSLRAGGMSRYRSGDGGVRTRIHTVDTLALSEYALRNDAFVFRVDPRIHGLFEGHGVATTWMLDVPRRSNNLDYRLITDVRLVLYYSAYYGLDLHDKVLSAPPKPGEMVHVRSLLLRYDFPEVWYTLLETGEATFSIVPQLLPRNEMGFTTQTLALQLMAADGVPVAGVPITLTMPGKAPVAMNTDATGQIAAQPGNPLSGQLGGPVLGDWHIAVKPAAGSPLLGADGKLDADKLSQIALLMQYNFAWPN